MVITARDILNRALVKSTILGIGQTAEGDLLGEALNELNSMLYGWSTPRTGIHSLTKETLTLSSGTASYTIGSGATFDTARPIRILNAFIRQSSVDYEIDIVDNDFYDDLALKSTAGRPYYLYYNPTYPNGTIYLYYAPDTNYSMHITSHKPLAQYSSVNTTWALPPEYEDPIINNLAVRLGTMFGRSPNPELVEIASNGYNDLEALHAAPPNQVSSSYPWKNGRYNIYIDEYRR